jgi:hypothetical protein
MSGLKIGDPVEVLDPGLLMLQRFAPPGAKPNNHGFVKEFDFGEGKDILVVFPIGDDPLEEHSQIVPYPSSMVRKRDK